MVLHSTAASPLKRRRTASTCAGLGGGGRVRARCAQRAGGGGGGAAAGGGGHLRDLVEDDVEDLFAGAPHARPQHPRDLLQRRGLAGACRRGTRIGTRIGARIGTRTRAIGKDSDRTRILWWGSDRDSD